MRQRLLAVSLVRAYEHKSIISAAWLHISHYLTQDTRQKQSSRNEGSTKWRKDLNRKQTLAISDKTKYWGYVHIYIKDTCALLNPQPPPQDSRPLLCHFSPSGFSTYLTNRATIPPLIVRPTHRIFNVIYALLDDSLDFENHTLSRSIVMYNYNGKHTGIPKTTRRQPVSQYHSCLSVTVCHRQFTFSRWAWLINPSVNAPRTPYRRHACLLFLEYSMVFAS